MRVDKLEVSIADDGLGFPDEDEPQKGSGSRIVDALARQIGGTPERSHTQGGTHWSYVFPYDEIGGGRISRGTDRRFGYRVTMWFDGWPDIARVALSTLAIYAAVIVILRLAGKRSLAKLNIFDLVVTVALGSTLASIMLVKDLSITEGVTAFVSLAGLQWVVSFASLRVHWFKRLIRSDARLLLVDGKFLEEAMARERITQDEVEAAIRKDGHGRIEEVTAVVLESDGTLSVIVEGEAADCTALRSIQGPDDPGD